MGSQERQREKPNQLKEQKVKSLEFFKPILATTLAIVLAWLLSVRPAQAGGYTVTLQQVGPNVVATGSGRIDLTGLSSSGHLIITDAEIDPPNGSIFTGPRTTRSDVYYWWGGLLGAGGFGSGGQFSPDTIANSGSGDMVGIIRGGFYHVLYV